MNRRAFCRLLGLGLPLIPLSRGCRAPAKGQHLDVKGHRDHLRETGNFIHVYCNGIDVTDLCTEAQAGPTPRWTLSGWSDSDVGWIEQWNRGPDGKLSIDGNRPVKVRIYGRVEFVSVPMGARKRREWIEAWEA